MSREVSWMEVSLLNESKVAEAKRKSRSDSWCVHTVWSWQGGETVSASRLELNSETFLGGQEMSSWAFCFYLNKETMHWMPVSFG